SDFLRRTFSDRIKSVLNSDQFSKKTPDIVIHHCGQEMLKQSSLIINKCDIEVSFELGLPAAGSKIIGKLADNIFLDLLSKIVEQSLLYKHVNQAALNEQVTLFTDQEFIRETLELQHLVAFVANDSILPRKSGVSGKPLPGAVLFQSPEKFEIQMTLPSGKIVKG